MPPSRRSTSSAYVSPCSGSPPGRLRPSLEALDVKNVPGFLDRGLLGIVNGRLAARGQSLAWRMGRTLSVSAPLPRTIAPVDTFQPAVRTASVQVLDDAIELAVAFNLRFLRL